MAATSLACGHLWPPGETDPELSAAWLDLLSDAQSTVECGQCWQVVEIVGVERANQP